MRRTLKTFLLQPGKPTPTPPAPGPGIELEAHCEDARRAAGHKALAEREQRARALPLTPIGLAACVEAAE